MKAFRTNLLLMVILGAFGVIFSSCGRGGGGESKYYKPRNFRR